MASRKWKRARVELVHHDGMTGVWCTECGEFVPDCAPVNRCDKCGTRYRVLVESQKSGGATDGE